jgi:signal peptidase I
MEPTEDNHLTGAKLKSRNVYVAFLLSLLFLGLGQVYNGQAKKGAIFFGLLLIFPFLFSLTRLLTCFYGLLSLIIIIIVLEIWIIIDAVKNAKRQKEYVLKPYNTWYYYLLIAIGITAITYFYNVKAIAGIQNFRIPTISNCPTLQPGDLLIADMKAYKNADPQYGDIVVFKDPDEQFNTFRVVGLPGDNLEMIDNIVIINGKQAKATFNKETTCNNEQVSEFEEELPNGHKHLIYKSRQPKGTKTSIKNIVVPPESYFLLGDNRDNANDSRYVCSASKDRIKGRIIYSFWGKSLKRINIDFRDK